MKVAYIAGPYRANTINRTVENIRNAEKMAIKYWKKGYAVICPHKNTALFDGICPDETWLRGDIEIMKRCDLVVMVPGWETSQGSVTERDIAVKIGIKVVEP